LSSAARIGTGVTRNIGQSNDRVLRPKWNELKQAAQRLIKKLEVGTAQIFVPGYNSQLEATNACEEWRRRLVGERQGKRH
jgi:hypothetical protein